MNVRIIKEYDGAKPGVVRVYSRNEGLKVVAEGYGEEVRWSDRAEAYVPVRRVSVTVRDGAAARDKT